MKRILITVPNQHWVHKHVAHRLLLLQQDGRYRVRFDLPSHKPFENNLHHIVKDFLEEDFDYWLSIDADNPPIQNPLDLVEYDLDIVGCPTPVWHFTGKQGERSIYWNAYDYVEKDDAYAEHKQKEGLQKVDAIGTGCFLISRKVFEHPEMQRGAFTRKLYKDGTVHKGNDMSFCERAKENGFKIHAHYDYPCRHFNQLELTEVIQSHEAIK